MNQLEALRKMSVLVADTGDIDAIRAYLPNDATTNPSLLLAAAQKPEYRSLIDKAVHDTQAIGPEEARKEALLDLLFVNFGVEILKIVPGRVSTEVDAHLSFDEQESIRKAQKFISLYEKAGMPRERILIKLASTWEGVRAAEVLEMDGIHCNMTLMFSVPQAVACAEAKATLVSPFVGRVFDWYKKNEGIEYPPEKDPGVHLVREIYTYFKKFDIKTEVMGASFRNKGQITELAGCDLLTIGPKFLEELRNTTAPIERKLSPDAAKTAPIERLELNESRFRYLFNENPMAVDKLAEGIRIFSKDLDLLWNYVQKNFL